VNDVLIAVEALRRVVISGGHLVAWAAYNGEEAVSKCAGDIPDVILMDLLMPVMDGVEATRRIMQDSPCAILVVTATVTGNASKVFDAMGHGALDAVNTPVLGISGSMEGASPLLEKISMIGRLLGLHMPLPAAVAPYAKRAAQKERVVAIGASTGGPLSLARILKQLPSDFHPPIIIVQHVDRDFAPGLAEWLTTETGRMVRLIQPDDRPEHGSVMLAATNDHLILKASGVLDYTTAPKEYPYRPSVDVFFRSLRENGSAQGAAVLLTGMGRDGADGLLELRNAGWKTFAQDKATSVVFGMPRAAIEKNAAQMVLPDNGIAAGLIEWWNSAREAKWKAGTR